MSTTQETLSQSLDWFRHVGLVLLLHYVATAVITAVFRKRTPEEEAKLAIDRPRFAKLLKLARATGLDSPEAWKWIVSILFARTLKAASQEASDAGVPPEPPVDGPHR